MYRDMPDLSYRSAVSLANLNVHPSIWPPAPSSALPYEQSGNNQHVVQQPQLPIKVIFVIGAPGAGKGTICKQAAEKLGYYHLSAGDYLRDLANYADNYPAEAYAGLDPTVLSETMKRSQLISSEKMVEILRFKLEQAYKAGWTKLIVDGFPRSVDSAAAYEKVIGKPSMVMLVDCTKENAANRFVTRGREEGDTRDKFEKRYAQFQKETPAILDMYRSVTNKVDGNCDKAQALRAAMKHLEGQETIFDRTQRILVDDWDWKATIVVGAALVFGGVAFKRKLWRRY